MKNLKKVLALVLVVVMALGLITVSNAAFTDAEGITKKEAVDVLSAIGVLKGYDDGSFKPAGDVTRAEMAKMIAVIMNEGSEEVNDIYKEACKFADAKDNWAAGFIAYCAQAGIINGRNETTFDPNGNVTGVEAAKMLLCALGYDAQAEGFVGANWIPAVLAKAQDARLIGSDYNLSITPTSPLNRENAAQMMLNALKADMVKYKSKGISIVSNEMTINTGSETEFVTKESTNGRYIQIDTRVVTSSGAVYSSAGLVPAGVDCSNIAQLGEAKFRGLEIDRLTANATEDDFGHPKTTWKFEGKEVSSVIHEADLTFKDQLKGGELYTALGKIGLATYAEITNMYLNDNYHGEYQYVYYIDGVPVTLPTGTIPAAELTTAGIVVPGNLDDFGDMGDVIEIYKDNVYKTVRIVQTDYHVAEIKQVWLADKDTDGDLIKAGYVQLGDIATGAALNADAAILSTNQVAAATGTVESDAFTKEDRGTYVVYTRTYGATKNKLQSVAKAESLTGLFNSVVPGETVTIAGTTYNIDLTGFTYPELNADADAYLDPNGNVIWLEGYQSNNYAYLVQAKETSEIDSTLQGALVFADGTRKVVTLDKSGHTTQGFLYTYRETADGKYKLGSVIGTGIATNATYEPNTVTLPNGAKANANTIFVVETYDATAQTTLYAAYTGIANVPKITSTHYDGPTWGTYDAAKRAAHSIISYTKANEDFASVVFIFGAAAQSTSKNVTALYVTGNESVANDGNGDYYNVKAIVNGQETVLKVSDSVTGLALNPANPYLQVTNSMTIDNYGYVTTVAAMDNDNFKEYRTFAHFTQDATGVYNGTFSNGVIEVTDAIWNGVNPTTGSSFSVEGSLPVYAYNTKLRTFNITTADAYTPAKQVTKVLVKFDVTQSTQTPAVYVPTALYILENS